MIPFGSQRALGQDLATHLLNAQDNERMEVAQVRGAVARDLHGAFAEWEAQAFTLTRCTNYLYSLSVNPDQRQGRLTREQYLDYIDRVENRLGLAGQPRAVVFHVKKDRNGIPREHCHVVWSRIDAERGKARQVAFDHDKLMMVTREFARDHGLKLPDGYFRDKGQERPRKSRQLALYEKTQQDKGGLSREQHMARVTAAWHKRDTPRAFVRSLEDMGYILATGTRDYVLVDLHGNLNSLPKLIDDKTVRVKTLREFLGKDFPKDSLPTVDEARTLAAAHRKAIEAFRTDETRATDEELRKERREALRRKQQDRRAPFEQQGKGLAARQRQARTDVTARQQIDRTAIQKAYLSEARRVRLDRAAHRPTGLAAFLGRITGVELVVKTLHQFRDRKRYEVFLAQKRELAERQNHDIAALARRQELETLAMQRRLRALELVEKREIRSLETALLKERSIEDRERSGREPSREPHKDVFNEAARKPIDLMAAFEQAAAPVAEHAPTPRDEFNHAAGKPIDLIAVFDLAADSGEGRGDASGDSAQDPAPEAEVKIRRRRRRVQLSRDFNRAADEDDSKSGSGDTRARAPERPSPTDDEPRRRRKRNRDLDRGR